MIRLWFRPASVVGVALFVWSASPGLAQVQPIPVDRSDITLLAFENDSAALEAPFRSQIAGLAKTWKRQNMRAIKVVGHAADGGDHAAAAGLSRARAEAVKAEFVRNGIRPQYIDVFWHGDRGPAVRSPDGNFDVVEVVLVW